MHGDRRDTHLTDDERRPNCVTTLWGIAALACYAIHAGALLGAAVGTVSAGSCPLVLLIGSSNIDWAWTMVERSLAVGGLTGLVNGCAAGIVIVYVVCHAAARGAG